MIKCINCNGTKYIYGMGNMREKCPECTGKGFLPEPKHTPVQVKKSKKLKEVLNDGEV